MFFFFETPVLWQWQKSRFIVASILGGECFSNFAHGSAVRLPCFLQNVRKVPTQSLFPEKVLNFDHRSLGPGKVLSFSNFSSEWSWKSPYFLMKSRLMNPLPDVKHFISIASSLYQNSCFAKSDVLSQNLKSKKSPHICGIFLVYQHCEIHHRCPYNMRFGPRKVIETSLVLIHQKNIYGKTKLWRFKMDFVWMITLL